MKILYGVQGTGNGHLSRARAMATAFDACSVEVDYLFSGRAFDRYFDMQVFGDYTLRKGLTFVNIDGRVDYFRTVTQNNYLRFVRDVCSLDLASYDVVITDFEPITAWAGKLRRKTVISVGHQPAFDFPVPVACRDLRTSLVMRLFAPGTLRVGMHWAKFDAPILPPLIDVDLSAASVQPSKVLVYLPFESQEPVRAMLSGIPDYDFFIYAADSDHIQQGNLYLRPTSLAGFRRDLQDCSAVICNAGFELASECLALGKRLLVKPQGRQMEQASNALALTELGYGSALEKLSTKGVYQWLRHAAPVPRISFPDVADELARWIKNQDFREHGLQQLSESLWKRVRVHRPLHHAPAPVGAQDAYGQLKPA